LIIAVGLGLSELLLHLIIINLQSSMLDLKLCGLQFCHLIVSLELLDFLFTFSVDLTEADHLSLVQLQLTRSVLQIRHQLLRLCLIDVQQLFGFFKLEN